MSRFVRKLLACGVALGLSVTPVWAADEAKKAVADQKAEEAKAIAIVQESYEQALRKVQEQAEKDATHQLLKEVKIQGKSSSLQTLAVDADGRVLALVAPPRGFTSTQKNVTSEVHLLDPNGERLSVISVNFHANSVNAGPDGTIYVAGDGKMAKFSKDGKAIGEITELPFIQEMIKDEKGLKERAKAQLDQQRELFSRSTKSFKDRLKQLEDKAKAAKEKGEELSKSEQTQLKQFQQIVESYEQNEKAIASQSIESVVASIVGRAKIINSVSVNEKELFVVCGEIEGYGYSVWRMTHDLKDPKKVLSGLSGCCGQMDVQCCGEDILVAENTRHRFAKYDREGKELATGGKRGKETDPGCFGGCCNPMNVKACGVDVLTAESEGLIKKFGPTGEFKGIVGSVRISGGCKNVAVGSNADGSRIYFCDQPGSRVLILAAKADSKKSSNK